MRLAGNTVPQKIWYYENVSDREYVSNSFHCHVAEDITPIQKQDLEKRFWDLLNGGKIQYVKYPIDYNTEAVKTLIHRAMDMGFYEGVNLSLAYCDDCGHQELEMDVCPKCGSSNLTKIDRVNGYLSYSRVKGDHAPERGENGGNQRKEEHVMRYHDITKDDMKNGSGLRAVLWVAGCEHHCPGCHNPVTWNIDDGLPFDAAAKEELFGELAKPYISGVTFSGGDPLHQKNRDEVGALICEIKEKFPNKTVWVYTGYDYSEVSSLPFMDKVDVLVDGKFIETQKDTKLHWRGSANQKVIDVQKTRAIGEIVLYCN